MVNIYLYNVYILCKLNTLYNYYTSKHLHIQLIKQHKKQHKYNIPYIYHNIY